MAADEPMVMAELAGLVDPELGLAVTESGVLRSARFRRGRPQVVLALPSPDYPEPERLVRSVAAALSGKPGLGEPEVSLAVMDEAERAALRLRLGSGDIPTSARVLGISSGKGGVGKSSVTVNLAIALSRLGHNVAVLDADVYGFSIPQMLGARGDPMIIEDLVVPPVVNGVRCMSIGFFVTEDQPIIWRGPMLHKALGQFLADVWWAEVDFLLVDMPPGTGDVALSMAQYLPRSEVLVVTTPQPAAQRVAQRSAFAARKLKLSLRGVIENMSWFTGDDGTRYEIFGSGGGESLASALGVPLLGKVPLVPALRSGGDDGVPITVSDPDGEASKSFADLAASIAAMGPARVYRPQLTVRQG